MSDAPVRSAGVRGRRRVRERKRPGGSRALLLFFMFGAAPIGIVIYFFTLHKAKQQEILDKIPEGVGGRALIAGGLVVALIVLATIALPAFHGASASLKNAMDWIRTRPTVLRVLLFPVEFVLWLFWFAFQILFGLDAVAIIVCALGALLATVRIFNPEFMQSLVERLGLAGIG